MRLNPVCSPRSLNAQLSTTEFDFIKFIQIMKLSNYYTKWSVWQAKCSPSIRRNKRGLGCGEPMLATLSGYGHWDPAGFERQWYSECSGSTRENNCLNMILTTYFSFAWIFLLFNIMFWNKCLLSATKHDVCSAWQKMAVDVVLLEERTYFGAATLRNRLHVFGGQNLDYKAKGFKRWFI